MICKKCGREYEDDMTKCLWCGEPNEESSKPVENTSELANDTQQSAFDIEEPENVRRGKSAVTWLKICYILAIILGIFSEYAIGLFKPYMNLAKGETPPAMDFLSAISVLFYLFLIFVFSIVFLIAMYKFCRWLYFSIKTLRKFTSTEFSPLAALICTLIPWISGIFDYFIFKDVLERQQKVLAARGKNFATVPSKMLIGIPIMTVLCIAPYCYDSIVLRMLALVIALSVCVLYIKAMNAMIQNEKALTIIHEREILERKVDEILAQRENP